MARNEPAGEGTAEPWFVALAEAGDARAMVCLGDGAAAGRRDAERWYRWAAGLGEPEAMMRLGQLAWDAAVDAGGDPAAEQHRAVAADWYRRAAEAGHVPAMSRLANLTTDPQEQERWYARAFEAGDVQAARTFAGGLAYRNRGADAERWYLRVAEVDPLLVAADLAELLARQGRSAEAAGWYRTAAEAGSVRAMVGLAGELEKLGETAEARIWQDRYRKSLLRPGQSGAGAVANWGAVVLTAALTTAVVPFVQTLMAKAAEGTYTAVRDLLRKLFRDRADRSAQDHFGGELLIVQDPDPDLNVALHVWTDASHEAIRALGALDLGALGSGPGRPRRVYWNQATKAWQVLDQQK